MRRAVNNDERTYTEWEHRRSNGTRIQRTRSEATAKGWAEFSDNPDWPPTTVVRRTVTETTTDWEEVERWGDWNPGNWIPAEAEGA